LIAAGLCGVASAAAAQSEPSLAVLPFRVHSSKPIDYLGESLANLVGSRLEASGQAQIISSNQVQRQLDPSELAETQAAGLREIAQKLGVDFLVSGSVTELAGRYSLDIRVTPASVGLAGKSLVYTADRDEALLERVSEVADAVLAHVGGATQVDVIAVSVAGAFDLEQELQARLMTQPGAVYDAVSIRDDLAFLRGHPSVASASVSTERTPDGVVVKFKVVRPEALLAGPAVQEAREIVSEVRVRGNRRIESAAILARVGTKPGRPYSTVQVSRDVREINSLGFFRNVKVYTDETAAGRVVIFEVDENPVVRQISISGNENVDGEQIRDILTLTTGSTLDYPLLFENRERIATLYRALGYYLAEVNYEIETLSEHSIGIHFLVDENRKLKLRSITFKGNEEFSDGQLKEGFRTKIWRWWSYATSFLDNSGTYSEPLFLQDLQGVQQKYADAGYLQVNVGSPNVIPEPDGIDVVVQIDEGRRFSVGTIDVLGDETVDVDRLKQKLLLKEGEILNRSHLSDSVSVLTEHYQDRGFFYAEVQPQTNVSQDTDVVDIVFRVRKGPLYFIREIDISGNTLTVDPVLRREIRVVEGELYSQRKILLSRLRLERLGFFEEVDLSMEPTDQPEQLDMEIRVVEKPTGSFSFGAGFSSQDGFVVTGSLSQANLFGRGYAASASVDYGGSTQRFYLSLVDPYFLGSDWSLGLTVFRSSVKFEDFEQEQIGFEVVTGHDISEDGRTRLRLRYSYASRELADDSEFRAAALIFRELLSDKIDTSLVGMTITSDTRNDALTPTGGWNLAGSLELAGPLGFAQFLRSEGRAIWYLGAPWWMPERSSFVVGTRLGYALAMNDVGDWDLPSAGFPDKPVDPSTIRGLDQIDDDLTLPLSERYFLGGLGEFQLRGYRGRSVGPRRPVLYRSGLGENLYLPVGMLPITVNSDTGELVPASDPDAIWTTVCDDEPGSLTGGNQNGVCNTYSKNNDLDETDVIGGNKFISTSFEYRFPISETLGLQGVLFFDAGNAFVEGDSLFDPSDWRYGTGVGVQWFSPFGPLAVVLGFPLDRESEVEDSPVFEFSVGGRDF